MYTKEYLLNTDVIIKLFILCILFSILSNVRINITEISFIFHQQHNFSLNISMWLNSTRIVLLSSYREINKKEWFELSTGSAEE